MALPRDWCILQRLSTSTCILKQVFYFTVTLLSLAASRFSSVNSIPRCRFAVIHLDLKNTLLYLKLDEPREINNINALIAPFNHTLHRQGIASIIYHSIIIMPPFRNLFNKKAPVVNGLPTTADENVRPSLGVRGDYTSERSSYTGSRASSSLSIKPRKEETAEYKLSGSWAKRSVTDMVLVGRANPRHSVVNDSGVYLPVSNFQGPDATALAHSRSSMQ